MANLVVLHWLLPYNGAKWNYELEPLMYLPSRLLFLFSCKLLLTLLWPLSLGEIHAIFQYLLTTLMFLFTKPLEGTRNLKGKGKKYLYPFH